MDRDAFIAYTARTDITDEELPTWFATVRDFLQDAYIAADTPWQQSGKSGTYAEWVRLRVPIIELINTDGTLLDIGCANGFLLECLLGWSAAKGIDINPYGLDIGEKSVALARQRLPHHANHLYVGNSWDWQPPHRFDYVCTELVYVPVNFQPAYVERLLADVVAPGGTLIIAHYRSNREDLSTGWHDDRLTAWGYEIAAMSRGFSGLGYEQTRFVAINQT